MLMIMVAIGCRKDLSIEEPLIGDAGVATPVYDSTYGDANIVDGYLKRFAINSGGDSLELYINAKKFITKARVAVYDGRGSARFYFNIDTLVPQKPTNANAPEDGYGYPYKVTIRNLNLPTGYYSIGNKIPFIVRDITKRGNALILYPTNTINAYNTAGGKSTYTPDEATTVSFLRPTPFVDQFMGGFIKSYQSIRGDFDWIEDRDMQDYSNIANYKVLVVPGHSEYWTREARVNLDRFIAKGGHVVILGGNNLWWQVRYSDDRTQMICYKDLPDPIADAAQKTINWNKPQLGYPIIPSIGAEFTNAGYGTKIYLSTGVPLDLGWDGYKILNPQSPFFAGLNLLKGDILSCPGKEWDGSPTVMVNGEPRIDSTKWNPYKVELLAYDMVTRSTSKNTNTVGTMVVFKATATSGTVFNACNTNWCATNGMTGMNGAQLKLITSRAINDLVSNKNMFTY